MCPIQDKSQRDKENQQNIDTETKGDWSDVVSITTLEMQTIDKTSCGTHANHIVRGNENVIVFNKSGVVVGMNPYTFGVCSFDLKLELQAAHHSSEDSDCIKLGKYLFDC